MFENDKQLRKWLKDNFPYEELSAEELKEQFIANFGEDKWEEIEALKPIEELNYKLCNFLGIEPVPVVFEEMYQDARYYDELDYIALSTKFVHDEIECMKSIIHEVKHLHQKYCISHKNEKNLKFINTLLIKQWEEDFKKNQSLIPEDQLMCMPVEVDAFAFTKYILKEWFNIEYHHYDPTYDALLEVYIDKFYK